MNNFRIPVSVVDDFWFDPHSLVDYAKTLTFNGPSGDHHFPGVRCNIEQKNPELFSSIINSVLSLFVDVDDQTEWQASLAFQITDSSLRQGWIHQDDGSLMAFILYLNDFPDTSSGTSIFKRKIYDTSLENESIKDLKRRTHKGELPLDENYFDVLNQFNSQFEETVEVKNQFNRLLVFDSNTYHGVKKFVDNRLTLVGFINGLKGRKYYN